jgi:hypothetical protein
MEFNGVLNGVKIVFLDLPKSILCKSGLIFSLRTILFSTVCIVSHDLSNAVSEKDVVDCR